ncbi:MAG TPA: DNA translocase FtsK [Spirillospora sp.]|nr:DNA translocase FtsK [Spirillospora sp.]
MTTLNILAPIEVPGTTPDSRHFYLSEYLSDTARIHHEVAHFDLARYREAVHEVRRLRVASVDFLRRHLRLDYPQAVRFIHCMEADGIIQRTDHRSRDTRRGWRYEVVLR